MIDFLTLMQKRATTPHGEATVCAIVWNNASRVCAITVCQNDNESTHRFCIAGKKLIAGIEETGRRIFLQQEVLGSDGNKLGKVQNATFTSGGTLRNITAGGVEYAKSKILCVGDVILIKQKPAQKAAKRPPDCTKKQVAANKKHTPQFCNIRKSYGDFSFLLGRKVDKTIVNFQGEVMIKATRKITKSVLKQAKISGKLIELCLHCK